MERQNEEIRREDMGNPYQTPMNRYGSAIILLTNPENELHKMEMTLRSARSDADGNIIQIGEPLMNEFGINSVIGTTQSIVNRVTILSNLDKDNIMVLMDMLGDTLARDLMMNKKEYGIKSTTARDKIYFTVLSTSFVTLKRAFQEGDKRFWKGSVQETRITQEREKSGGFLSGLNPWGGK